MATPRRSHGRPARQQKQHPPLPERADVFVVANEAVVHMALHQLMQRTKDDLKVFGLDCEWDLVTKKGQIHKPDILQIATVNGFCAMFRLHLLGKIPHSLRSFLEDPSYGKVGVGIVEDCDKLKHSWGVVTSGAVDIRFLADELNILPKGLSHLTKSVLGVDLTKHHHSFHQWTGNLSELQRQYAALDAIYSARVFYKMSHDRLAQVHGDAWRTWGADEYHDRTMAMWAKYVGRTFEFMRSNYCRNEMIDLMLAYTDLTPVAPGELSQGVEAVAAACEPEDPAAKEEPLFKARFANNKKEERKQRTEARLKRMSLRYFRKVVRRYEREGVDPRTIPTEEVPLKMLGPDGRLDVSRLSMLFKTD